jgi:hypothetical protein
MLFLAVRTDCPLLPEFRDQYIPMNDVECRECKRITYHLYAPISDSAINHVNLQAESLKEHLSAVCPQHPAWFLLPAAIPA